MEYWRTKEFKKRVQHLDLKVEEAVTTNTKHTAAQQKASLMGWGCGTREIKHSFAWPDCVNNEHRKKNYEWHPPTLPHHRLPCTNHIGVNSLDVSNLQMRMFVHTELMNAWEVRSNSKMVLVDWFTYFYFDTTFLEPKVTQFPPPAHSLHVMCIALYAF